MKGYDILIKLIFFFLLTLLYLVICSLSGDMFFHLLSLPTTDRHVLSEPHELWCQLVGENFAQTSINRRLKRVRFCYRAIPSSHNWPIEINSMEAISSIKEKLYPVPNYLRTVHMRIFMQTRDGRKSIDLAGAYLCIKYEIHRIIFNSLINDPQFLYPLNEFIHSIQ